MVEDIAKECADQMKMSPRISESPDPVHASSDAPPPPIRRLWRLREIARRRREREENNRRAPVIPLVCLGYFSAGVVVNIIDAEYLTAAWLFAGGLGIALWFAHEAKASLLNVYTVVLSVAMVVCLVFFVLTRGWLI